MWGRVLFMTANCIRKGFKDVNLKFLRLGWTARGAWERPASEIVDFIGLTDGELLHDGAQRLLEHTTPQLLC